MSIEIVYHPARATKADLKRHLISLGFRPTAHLWEWPKGSVHYHWFERRDYLSFDGVEATIFPVGAEDSDIPTPLGWALHTRVRSSGSSFDRDQQNHVIRTARKQFSIHKAFQEWLNIDFWSLIRRRRRVGQRVVRLQQRLDEIIESRHGVIHRFEFNRGLRREDLQDILATSLILIETLVDHLERDRNLHIKDGSRKKPSRRHPLSSPSITDTE
jgi:hypothetical protein